MGASASLHAAVAVCLLLATVRCQTLCQLRVNGDNGTITAKVSCSGGQVTAAADSLLVKAGVANTSRGVVWRRDDCGGLQCALTLCGNFKASFLNVSVTNVQSSTIRATICVAGNASVTFTGGTWSNNTAPSLAMYNFSTVAIDSGAVFYDNIASDGAGAAIRANDNAQITISDATFESNSNGGSIYGGGAIRSMGRSAFNISNSRFASNYGSGAAIFGRDQSSINIANSTFIDNWTPPADAGGVIYAIGNTSVVIVDSLFQNNTADYGGVVYADTGTTLSISGNSMLVNNTAQYSGGAVHIGDQVALDLQDGVSLEGNSAAVSGGALYSFGTATTTLGQVVFTANQAGANGGAVYLDERSIATFSSAANMTSLFADNTAVSGEDIYAGINTQLEAPLELLRSPTVTWFHRNCVAGEILIEKGYCERCPVNLYSFNATATSCDACPAFANCTGESRGVALHA